MHEVHAARGTVPPNLGFPSHGWCWLTFFLGTKTRLDYTPSISGIFLSYHRQHEWHTSPPTEISPKPIHKHETTCEKKGWEGLEPSGCVQQYIQRDRPRDPSFRATQISQTEPESLQWLTTVMTSSWRPAPHGPAKTKGMHIAHSLRRFLKGYLRRVCDQMAKALRGRWHASPLLLCTNYHVVLGLGVLRVGLPQHQFAR